MAHLKKDVIPDPIQGFKKELSLHFSSSGLVDKYTKIISDAVAKRPLEFQGKNPRFLALCLKYEERMQELAYSTLDQYCQLLDDGDLKENKYHVLRYYIWYKMVVENYQFPELDPIIYGTWTQAVFGDVVYTTEGGDFE